MSELREEPEEFVEDKYETETNESNEEGADIYELRSRIDALEERIDNLEDTLKGNSTPSTTGGKRKARRMRKTKKMRKGQKAQKGKKSRKM